MMFRLPLQAKDPNDKIGEIIDIKIWKFDFHIQGPIWKTA